MTKKYIDTDRLIEYLEKEADKEFKKTEENANSPVLCHFHNGCRMQALDTIDFIKELQQEQTLTDCNELQEPEVDLEKEVEKYFQGFWPGMETAEQCNTDMHFTPPAIMRLAKHFYELKNNAK